MRWFSNPWRARLRRGQTLVIMAIIVVALITAGGLVLDIGYGYLVRARLQNYCDAASLAGAQSSPMRLQMFSDAATAYELNIGATRTMLSRDATSSVYTIGPDRVTVLNPYTPARDTNFPPDKCIKVKASRNVGTFFMCLVGCNSYTVVAEAAAVGSPGGKPSAASGVIPFGILWNDFQYGQVIRIKVGPGDDVDYGEGNYGALALGAKGAQNYERNIKYGYPNLLMVDDWVPTEPGNMSGPTTVGVNYRINGCHHVPPCTPTSYEIDCPRVAVTPIVYDLDVHGRKDVQIAGFAAVFLLGVGGSGVNNWVDAVFLQTTIPRLVGDPDAPYYGISTSGSSRLID